MCKSLRADQIGWLFCFALPRASISGIDALIEVYMNYKERRKKLKAFYKSPEWRTARELALMRDKYLCQDCKDKPAEVVHHIIHLSEDNVDNPEISLNQNNLISICSNCHSIRHKGEHARGRLSHMDDEPYNYIFDANGMIVPKA